MAGLGILQLVAAGLAAFVVINCIIQATAVVLYVRAVMHGIQHATPDLPRWPRICVYVPVRGGGPDWRAALEHLLSLDYPDFQVVVLVDHPTDPAAEVIRALLKDRPITNLRMEFLQNPPSNRSLLCSGLIQFFEKLDPHCELVAFCGADMHLPPHFFREMAAPMVDPSVGSTLGNRWYEPLSTSWGSIIRYVWNAGAVVPMWAFQIAWGGASVLRPDDIRRSGLLEIWKKGMVEDAPIRDAMRKIGLRMEFVPKLLVVHDDAIDIRPCREFIKRQVFWTRLYHPRWSLVVLHAMLATAAIYAPWLFALVALVLGDTTMALIFAGAGLAYWICQAVLLALIDYAAGKISAANGSPLRSMNVGLLLKIFLAIPLTQLLFAIAVVRCIWLTRVQWSGIEYEIGKSREIRLLNYHPITPSGSIKP